MTFGDFANARIAERRATELAIEARQATALADAQAAPRLLLVRSP